MLARQRRLFGAVVLVISVVLALPRIGTSYGQEDGCAREAVIASFATAASSDTVNEWLQGYQNGSCPAAIKEGAQALADAYEGLGTATAPEPAAADGILREGEYPVLHVTNALGTEEAMGVYSFEPTPDAVRPVCYVSCLSFETAPGVYVGIQIDRLREAVYDAGIGQYNVVIDSGEQFTGTLYSVLVHEAEGGTVDLTGTDQITLYSLPEAEPDAGTPAAAETWTLHATAPVELTYTGVPFFTYTYYSSAGYLIGGEDHYSKSTQFQIDVQGRFVSAEIGDIQAIALSGAETIDITTADGRTINGAVQFVAHDSEGDHIAYTWGLGLALSDGVYVTFASDAVLTLTHD